MDYFQFGSILIQLGRSDKGLDQVVYTPNLPDRPVRQARQTTGLTDKYDISDRQAGLTDQ